MSSLERRIDRLCEYAQEHADVQAEAWLEALVTASYAVIDAHSSEALDEALAELGSLLPVRGE